jgi:hypothetical protein
MDTSMRDEIILIGPQWAGKSTQGQLVAARLRMPRCSLDEARWSYYQAAGYDADLAQRTIEVGGFLALYWYWKPFEIDSLERLVAEHSDCVFDLGAGHSVYEHREFFERARRALAPFRNVVLLLPSPDIEISVQLLRARGAEEDMASDFDFTTHFVTHPSNRELATHVVYSAGKTPDETCDEILAVTGVG